MKSAFLSECRQLRVLPMRWRSLVSKYTFKGRRWNRNVEGFYLKVSSMQKLESLHLTWKTEFVEVKCNQKFSLKNPFGSKLYIIDIYQNFLLEWIHSENYLIRTIKCLFAVQPKNVCCPNQILIVSTKVQTKI